MISPVFSDEGDYSDFCSDASTTSSVSTSSSSSEDEDVSNERVAPLWDNYRQLFEKWGYHLDTCRDVRLFYIRYWESRNMQSTSVNSPGYSLALRGEENELCKDAGLPERLFRGTRICDGTKIILKAVHRHSREFDIVKRLSTSPLRDCDMNHCIPVLDMIEPPEGYLAFIVMEEWSPHLMPNTPCTLRLFLIAMQQCIEHIAFMHSHHMAHLDISLRNMLTDYQGRYACIDFECSRRFEPPKDGDLPPRIGHIRGTELPPEAESRELADPYKVDIWALGILIRRACLATGYRIAEMWQLTKMMLHERFEYRPSADVVLKEFNYLMGMIDENRLEGPPMLP